MNWDMEKRETNVYGRSTDQVISIMKFWFLISIINGTTVDVTKEARSTTD